MHQGHFAFYTLHSQHEPHILVICAKMQIWYIVHLSYLADKIQILKLFKASLENKYCIRETPQPHVCGQ